MRGADPASIREDRSEMLYALGQQENNQGVLTA
jgi:hypothetical protein